MPASESTAFPTPASHPDARPELGVAQLADEGKLAPLLKAVYGPTLAVETENGVRARFPTASVDDELLAADDFYFRVIDLMDCCLVARVDGALVGAACVNPYVCELQFVAVLPEWRRRGIGRRLTEMALAELRRRGGDHVRAEAAWSLADDGGRDFLTALGFHEIRRAVVMGRTL